MTLPLLNREWLKERFPELTDVTGTDPVGIIQFGGGNFLRAYFDHYLHEARSRRRIRKRVSLVISQGVERAGTLRQQDAIFMLRELGGQTIPIDVFGEVLTAHADHTRLLSLAVEPAVDLWVSNVTAGALLEPPAFDGDMPVNHAGRVAAMLRARAAGSPEASLTILCMELTAADNGVLFENLLREYFRGEPAVAEYLKDRVSFPVTLVDRIVPGQPKDTDLRETLWREAGCRDLFLVEAEAYRTLHIQPRGANNLTWIEGLPGVTFTGDVKRPRTLKLRLLNATHTAMTSLGLALAVPEVAQFVADKRLSPWLHCLMEKEIVPTIPPPAADAAAFAQATLERFSNQALHHHLSSILLEHTSKIKERWLPVLEWHREHGEVPAAFSLALGATLFLFCRARKLEGETVLDLPGGTVPFTDGAAETYLAWLTDDTCDISTGKGRDEFLRRFVTSGHCPLAALSEWKLFLDEACRWWEKMETLGVAAALVAWNEEYAHDG